MKRWETVSARIKVKAGYSQRNKIEGSDYFKALPETGLDEKGKQAQGGKKQNNDFIIAFFVVNAAGEKVDELIK